MSSERWQEVKETLAAALEVETAERPSFLESACRHDAALRTEVEMLLNQTTGNLDAATKIIGVAWDDRPDQNKIGRRVGAYELIREIGRGGMGAVWLARRADRQFEKLVAVKLLKRGTDTDEVLRRFQEERQILARLEHPNIARLLDGGTTDDGLPFFAIEYVDGIPITAYATQNELNIRERLELFRTVCSAVSYAHQNLIIHRDLKPANVLVTCTGEVKLLDFGIAKIVQEAEAGQADATLTVHRVMTPEYASPEQVSGQPVSTVSDVYSLGVFLFELLTGKRPYRLKSRAPDEVTKAILEQEPDRPSTAVTRNVGHAKSELRTSKLLKGDLDTIVLKALQKEPQRRYVSVDQFSADIRRHLEGLPVRARKDTAWYRSSKFIRRHKLGVGAAALVVLILAAGTIGTAAQAQRANRRFNEVRKLAHSVLFDYHDQIAALPGSTKVRARLVHDALEYLDNLAHESSGNIGLLRELGTAYEKVGEIQGNSYYSNLGDTAGAMKSYQKSLAIRQQLAAAAPKDPAVREELASSYEGLGDMYYSVDDLRQALTLYERSRELREPVTGGAPTDETARLNLCQLYMKIGDVKGMEGFLNLGDTAGAVEAYSTADRLLETMARASPQEKAIQSKLGNNLAHLGMLQDVAGQYGDAIASERRALGIFEKLLAADPINQGYRMELFTTRAFARYAMEDNNLIDEAIAQSRDTLAGLQAMLKTDPNNNQTLRGIGVMLNAIGHDLLLKGDAKGALENHRQALQISQQMLGSDPESKEKQSDVAFTLEKIGEAELELNDDKAAAENFEKALSMRDAVSNANPADSRAKEGVVSLCHNLGVVRARLNDAQGAESAFERALLLAEERVTRAPTNIKAKTALAKLWLDAGKAFLLLAQRSNDLRIAKKAAESLTNSTRSWDDLRNHGKLAPLYSGKLEETKHLFEQARLLLSSASLDG